MSSEVKRGSIEISDESIVYRVRGEETSWSVPIGQIVLIAEYTNDKGPYCDDYFLVFVWIDDGKVNFAECSFYAEGSSEIVSTLGKEFGMRMELGLAHSTEWDSRVIWPPELAGGAYFEFHEAVPRKFGESPKVAIWNAIGLSAC